jgi:hypothetical protein
MSKVRSRIIAVIGGLASAVIIKWAFDRWVWDVGFQQLARFVDFDMAASVSAVLSYLVPLAAACLAYAALSPHSSKDDHPSLRKHPWQSRRLIVGLLIVIVATIAGLSYGRIFGLPSITLPRAR